MWTNQKPTQPGWYWVRERQVKLGRKPWASALTTTPVLVEIRNEVAVHGLTLHFAGWEGTSTVEDVHHSGVDWHGPVRPPALPEASKPNGPMTVADLIAQLSELPPDAEVLVDGYEGGAQAPKFVGLWKFRRDYYGPKSHCGPHRPQLYGYETDPDEEYDDERPDFTALFLSRSKQTL